MAELKCPHCGQAFTVDDTELGSILQQIRDKEFEKDVNSRVSELERHLKEKHDLELAAKEQALAAKEQEVKLAEQREREKELAELRNELERAKEQALHAKAQLDAAEDKKKIAVMEAEEKAQRKLREEIDKNRALEKDLANEKNNHAVILAEKDAQIAQYRDMKLRLSTKMIGESLEQHCEMEFNKIRMTAFPRAQFGKDNEISKSGSKGDYIYREFDENGVEIISIMFEMKNESEETATKHKNEDFFKELDKDRREKNCEYAVLVSLLEKENDFYNGGIADVSYRYEKMYVVRPQCFIPIISLLRNAAMNALTYKQELIAVRNQNIDISNFEDNLLKFKQDFGRNYEIAHKHFDNAIEEIDKTISHLEKVKKELLGSDNQLRLATRKVDEVSVKKLTKDNPTMQEKFEAARNGK